MSTRPDTARLPNGLPTVFAQGAWVASGIAVDATAAYWIDYSGGRILRLDK